MRYVIGLSFLTMACFLYAQTNPGNQQPQGAGPGGRMGWMSPEMRTKCQMMMQTQILPNDPAALLALRDQLKLTEDQIGKLQAISDQARKDAAAVLNDQQKQQVANIPAMPDTSVGMHQNMGRMMRRQGGQRGRMQMNCPMMNMMDQGATTQPAPSDTPAGDNR